MECFALLDTVAGPRRIQTAAFALATAALTFATEPNMTSRVWSFDSDTTGRLAQGFSAEVGEWQVKTDDTAPSKEHVLAQVAKSPKPTYNVALLSGTKARDLDLSVQLRPVTGEIDQGGGVVWRAKDAKNYYICRYNPLEDNFRVYKVEDGKRTELASADVARSPGWHAIRVTMKGEHIACYLDGKKLMESNDATFEEAGKIGLWTKADAQTHFDDLTLKAEPM